MGGRTGMIQINDNDLPITVAEKLVNGTKFCSYGPLAKAVAKAVCGDEKIEDLMDMFTLEELKEIADYLIVYYEANKA